MDDQTYAFVFRALLAEEALDRAGRRSRLPQSAAIDGDVAERVALAILDGEHVARARRMATVYTAIAAFENSVRQFVSSRLLESVGAGWWASCVSERIRARAEGRQAEEAKVRWHTPRGEQPINFTEFGDLASIINQNWPLFEPHLVTQDWVRHILTTLERSRNVIMHSGELANADVERVGTVIRDWVRQVGA